MPAHKDRKFNLEMAGQRAFAEQALRSELQAALDDATALEGERRRLGSRLETAECRLWEVESIPEGAALVEEVVLRAELQVAERRIEGLNGRGRALRIGLGEADRRLADLATGAPGMELSQEARDRLELSLLTEVALAEERAEVLDAERKALRTELSQLDQRLTSATQRRRRPAPPSKRTANAQALRDELGAATGVVASLETERRMLRSELEELRRNGSTGGSAAAGSSGSDCGDGPWAPMGLGAFVEAERARTKGDAQVDPLSAG